MSTSRNAPCPCGSGKKYKKCCLDTDEAAAAEKRAQQRAEEQKKQQHQKAEQKKYYDYIDQLEQLSNHANDLIHAKEWEKAHTACLELKERFPREIDADMRFSEYYKAKGEPENELKHLQQYLKQIEKDPEEFDDEILEDIRADIVELKKRLHTT